MIFRPPDRSRCAGCVSQLLFAGGQNVARCAPREGGVIDSSTSAMGLLFSSRPLDSLVASMGLAAAAASAVALFSATGRIDHSLAVNARDHEYVVVGTW